MVSGGLELKSLLTSRHPISPLRETKRLRMGGFTKGGRYEGFEGLVGVRCKSKSQVALSSMRPLTRRSYILYLSQDCGLVAMGVIPLPPEPKKKTGR